VCASPPLKPKTSILPPLGNFPRKNPVYHQHYNLLPPTPNPLPPTPPTLYHQHYNLLPPTPLTLYHQHLQPSTTNTSNPLPLTLCHQPLPHTQHSHHPSLLESSQDSSGSGGTYVETGTSVYPFCTGTASWGETKRKDDCNHLGWGGGSSIHAPSW
jgi:hypothetical protein